MSKISPVTQHSSNKRQRRVQTLDSDRRLSPKNTTLFPSTRTPRPQHRCRASMAHLFVDDIGASETGMDSQVFGTSQPVHASKVWPYNTRQRKAVGDLISTAGIAGQCQTQDRATTRDTKANRSHWRRHNEIH
jgi:hypothetical protein